MKIEVRGVKEAKFASEETMCFEATVVIDGKVAGRASNDGKGGSNRYEPWALGDRLSDYAKTLPRRTIEGMEGTFETDADLIIDDLVVEFLSRRDFERAMKGRVIIETRDGQIRQTKKLPKGTDPLVVAKTFVGRPDVVRILNLLPADEAFQAWKRTGT